jgi:hypothetical protein
MDVIWRDPARRLERTNEDAARSRKCIRVKPISRVES